MGDLTENFSRREFACRCGCGSDQISMELVNLLQIVRDQIDFPLIIRSGVRCPEHNAKVGGKPNSSHIKGLAADIECVNGRMRYLLLRVLLNYFHRIEVGEIWLHVDVDKSKPQDVIFLED